MPQKVKPIFFEGSFNVDSENDKGRAWMVADNTLRTKKYYASYRLICVSKPLRTQPAQTTSNMFILQRKEGVPKQNAK